MIRFFSFPAALLMVAGPVAAQPYSQSMAQCAGLYEAVQVLLTEHENIEKIEAAAAAFGEAALEEARVEGQADPEVWVEGHRTEMYAEWREHGGLKVFSEDFVDWTDYCRSFADDRGIDMDFD